MAAAPMVTTEHLLGPMSPSEWQSLASQFFECRLEILPALRVVDLLGRLFKLALGFREIALLSAADTTRLGHDSAGGEA